MVRYANVDLLDYKVSIIKQERVAMREPTIMASSKNIPSTHAQHDEDLISAPSSPTQMQVTRDPHRTLSKKNTDHKLNSLQEPFERNEIDGGPHVKGQWCVRNAHGCIPLTAPISVVYLGPYLQLRIKPGHLNSCDHKMDPRAWSDMQVSRGYDPARSIIELQRMLCTTRSE
jgi:hypothetical protein